MDGTANPRGVSGWLILLLGIVIGLIGLTLAIGGVWLIALGGSWYYGLAGLGLIAAGVLLALQRRAGAWSYVLVFALTAIWAFWEVGLNGWALVPRIVAPAVLLFPVILALPWLWPRANNGKWALAILAASILFIGATGVAVVWTVKPALVAQVPEPSGTGLPQPAPMQVGVDWPAYAGTYDAQHFSPLKQISIDNIGRLQRAWVYRTGDIPDKRWGAETTPIKIGGSVYLCSARNIMIALDAATGEVRWRYDPKVLDQSIPYTAACRGVTYYAVPNAAPGQACATRIIEGTLDARLIAVDAVTGRPCTDFGKDGQVDATKGMGETLPGYVSINSPPVIVKGVLVTGHQVLDSQARWEPSGVILGYDAVTGQLRWAWDMMQPNLNGLPPKGEIFTRGTPNMWTMASGDEQLGLVYLPMGNSTVDYYTSLRRPNEKEFSTSLVALDVTTGKPAWHFQAVHVDAWDYDLGSQATLVDYPTGSGTTKAIVLPSKQGDIYVLDRKTGQPLTQVEERPVPGGGVEPEQRAKTQPFSLYHSLRKPDLTERDMWGMSPIDQMICRIGFEQASYKGIYTPPTSDRFWIQYPGYNGGSDWGGIGVDPQRGVIVANYNDMPNHNRLVPRAVVDKRGWLPRDKGADQGGGEGAGDPQLDTPYGILVNAGWQMPYTGMLCKQPPYGGITAFDLKTGKTLWDRPFGKALRNGPFGIPSMLPITIGTPNNGGPALTAGGLVFVAAATDDLIHAIDIRTGKTVWTDKLPAGGQATPMLYEADGREYLVIVAAGHHFMKTPKGDYVIAYALPKEGEQKTAAR